MVEALAVSMVLMRTMEVVKCAMAQDEVPVGASCSLHLLAIDLQLPIALLLSTDILLQALDQVLDPQVATKIR